MIRLEVVVVVRVELVVVSVIVNLITSSKSANALFSSFIVSKATPKSATRFEYLDVEGGISGVEEVKDLCGKWVDDGARGC